MIKGRERERVREREREREREKDTDEIGFMREYTKRGIDLVA